MFANLSLLLVTNIFYIFTVLSNLWKTKEDIFPPPYTTADFSPFLFPHQGDWSQAITLHVTVPGGGVVGISEGAGVSSIGVSFAGGLGSETASVAAGVSFGGAAPKLTENGKNTWLKAANITIEELYAFKGTL